MKKKKKSAGERESRWLAVAVSASQPGMKSKISFSPKQKVAAITEHITV